MCCVVTLYVDRWVLRNRNKTLSTRLAGVFLQLLLHFGTDEELGRQPAVLPEERCRPGHYQQQKEAGPFHLEQPLRIIIHTENHLCSFGANFLKCFLHFDLLTM